MRRWENTPLQIVCFRGTNGVGKTTQALLLADALDARGVSGNVVDTYADIIRPEIWPETLPERTYDFTLRTRSGSYNTTRSAERQINIDGELNTREWVAWLVCEALRTQVMQESWPIFSGSPRSQLEAEEFAATLDVLDQANGPLGLIIVEVRPPDGPDGQPDYDIVRQRIIDDVMSIEDEAIRAQKMYKIEEFDRRAATYAEETVPAFDWLVRYAPIAVRTLRIVDDGTRTAEEIHEEVLASIKMTLAITP